MSHDRSRWSPPRSRSDDGRGRHGRPDPRQRAAVEEARAALQDQFYRVDRGQAEVRATVEQYAALLPDRAARTGVVPGWTELDKQASRLIVEYLAVLDDHDPIEDADPQRLAEAGRDFAALTPQLGRLGDDLAGFLERFGSELARVGEAQAAAHRDRVRVAERIAAADAAVERAEAAWRGLADVGLQVDAADRAVAQARVARRHLDELAPRLTPTSVEEPAGVVEGLAEQAFALASALPRRAEALGRRLPSLATRVDALENRAAGVPETLRTLRREYAAASWADLDHAERDLGAGFADVRGQLAEVARRHRDGQVSAALTGLEEVERAVAGLATAVDAPRTRLELLRSMSADPGRVFDRIRFRLRDARYLILDGRAVAPQPWAGRLDAAAAELIALEPLAAVPHPDWWGLHRRLDALDARVGELIADVRAAHAG